MDGEKAEESASAAPWDDFSTFYTHSRDDDTIVVSFRIPQAMAREIAIIVESGKHPDLKTYSDCYRDATWRWLRRAAEDMGNQAMALQLDTARTQGKMQKLADWHSKLNDTIDLAEKMLDQKDLLDSTRRVILTELSDMALRLEHSPARRRVIEIVAKYR